MLRFISVLVVAGVLGGCVTTGSPTNGGPVPVARLQAENKSIVIVHTSLHEQSPVTCMTLMAVLAQPDASGQYVIGRSVYLRNGFEPHRKLPSRIELPAGQYGIVQLECGGLRNRSTYRARMVKRGNILDGSRPIYEPIAAFTVAPGEVVDIGSLRLHSRPRSTTPTLAERLTPGGPPGAFAGAVTPIPDGWLQNLAKEEPSLYQARVVRPMTVGVGI